ncbi:SRPBCC family protein [Snuella lapsa]|uniref:SRPBCC family protein n=1 Tax=Snuella lapsa TaxID=870481 RepID=A0ABP6WKQ0_9FLAO
MKLYRLHKKQKLPISVDMAWEFLSNPNNLSLITPDNLGFNILSGAEKPMFAGQIIQYHISPLWGIKTTWVTEITHMTNKLYFVDEQRFGPYALWHHKHFIHDIDGGIEMEDIIDYKLPFGIIGQLMHIILVKSKLEDIFQYRSKKLETLFGTYNKETN